MLLYINGLLPYFDTILDCLLLVLRFSIDIESFEIAVDECFRERVFEDGARFEGVTILNDFPFALYVSFGPMGNSLQKTVLWPPLALPIFCVNVEHANLAGHSHVFKETIAD